MHQALGCLPAGRPGRGAHRDGALIEEIGGLLAAAGQAIVQRLVRPVQAVWLAGLFLARRVWWALHGQPCPPAWHASPSFARLKACQNAANIRELAAALGCDENGAQPALQAAQCACSTTMMPQVA